MPKKERAEKDIESKLKAINQEVNRVLGHQRNNVQVIRTEEELEQYISSCIENRVIAIDTETNNSLDPITCQMMGLCLYSPGLKQVYVPLNHRDYVSKKKLPYQLDYRIITKELAKVKEANIEILMHNGKFDYEVIKRTCDIEIIPTWDTMLAAKVLDETEKAGLKWQYKHHINYKQEEYKIDKLFDNVAYADVDIDVFALYAATDALMTYELYKKQKASFELPENEKIFKLFKSIEMPMVQIVGDMELVGAAVDLGYVQKLKQKYIKKLEKKTEELYIVYEAFKERINEWITTSNAQRNDLLEPTNTDYKKESFDNKFNISNDITGLKIN